MKLSELIQDQNSRVGALENEDLDDSMGIAKITKVYADVKLHQQVKVTRATYNLCGPSFICSPTKKNTSNYEELIY